MTNYENAQENDVNPLTPPPPPEKKTRFSHREDIVQAEKKADQARKAKEKAASTVAPVSAQEQATEKEQAAPMGLNGDTAKKEKPKKVKGAKKQRLENKPQPSNTPPTQPAPTVNPSLGSSPLAPGAVPPPTTPPSSKTTPTATPQQ